MKSKDAISARLAECFVTIGDRRYNFMQIINFEAKIDKTKSKVPRLGTIMIGHKSVAQEGTYSGKAHYNQSVMRECLADFKRTGEDTYFEIQVTNDDPASAAQRQTVVFYDCLTDGGTLAKFNADSEYLDEDISGTFDDYSIPEDFTELDGFATN
jgi:hypothetical protein